MKTGPYTRTVSEFLGTAFFVAAVIGSGIMGEWLAGGPSYSPSARLGLALLKQGKLAEAVDSLQPALQRNTKAPDASMFLGIAHAHGNEHYISTDR